MNSRNTVVVVVLFVLLAFAVSFISRSYSNNQNTSRRFHLDAEKYQSLGGDFTLPSTSGAVQLSQLTSQGTVVLQFGFTRCPDVCPTTLANLGAALALLSAEERKNIIPIMISADPEYDTLERLDQYVRFFVPEMIGLRGSYQQAQELATMYGAYIQKVDLPASSIGYTIDHTTRLYVITQEGIQTLFEHNQSPEEIADILRNFAS